MRAAAFGIAEEPGDAVGPDAGVVQKTPVGGTGEQGGNHWRAGPHFGGGGLDGFHQFRRQRRRCGFGGGAEGGDFNLVVG